MALQQPRPTVGLAEPPSAEFRCLACALSFGTLEDLKVHYKAEFHRANLQRKVSGLGPISAEEFERRSAAGEQQQQVRNSGRALLTFALAVAAPTAPATYKILRSGWRMTHS
jgi:hypothetical protein